MKRFWFLFLLFFITGFAQNIKIKDREVWIDTNKIAILNEVSYRYKYELWDLNNNDLLLRAQVVKCNSCKETNEITFEVSNAQFSNTIKINILETSFSRSKELIKMLYQKQLLDANGVYPDRLNESLLRTQAIAPALSNAVLASYDLTAIAFKGDDLYVNNLLIGKFKAIPSRILLYGKEVKFTKSMLLDLDGNYIASYVTLDKPIESPVYEYVLLSDVFQWNKILLRNGETFVMGQVSVDQIAVSLAEKAILEGYKLEHDIKVRTSKEYFKSLKVPDLELNEQNNGVYLVTFNNDKGIGGFKVVPGLTDQIAFNESKSQLWYKSFNHSTNAKVVKGYANQRVTLENYISAKEFISFKIQNSDVFEKIETVQSVLDDRRELFEFREIVFENQKYIVAKDRATFVIKDKDKSKGIRLDSENKEMLKLLEDYLLAKETDLIGLNTKSLESIVLLLQSLNR